MRTPMLHTKRLDLRPFTVEDDQDVFECRESDSDVAKYMLFLNMREQVKRYKRY